jgi:hypothetical protein
VWRVYASGGRPVHQRENRKGMGQSLCQEGLGILWRKVSPRLVPFRIHQDRLVSPRPSTHQTEIAELEVLEFPLSFPILLPPSLLRLFIEMTSS